MKCRWADDDGRPLCTRWAKNACQYSQIEPIIWREIGSAFPGSSNDEELLFQKEIFGDESLRAARLEQFGNRGQKMGENQA